MKSMVAYNGREIPKEDKVFAACGKALDAVSKYGPAEVINATVGALYDGRYVLENIIEVP